MVSLQRQHSGANVVGDGLRASHVAATLPLLRNEESNTHRVVEARTYGALILFGDGRAGGRRPTCSPGGWERAPLKGGPDEGDYFAGACVPEASSEGGPPGGLARRYPTSPHQPRGLRNPPRLGIVRSCQIDLVLRSIAQWGTRLKCANLARDNGPSCRPKRDPEKSQQRYLLQSGATGDPRSCATNE
jgi:hypothetical protein